MEICNYVQGRISTTPLQFRFISRRSGFQKTLKSTTLYPPHLICNSSGLKSEEKEAKLESTTNSSTMFILGMGFVGQFVGEQLKKESCCRKVFGTCKHSSKKKELERLGFDVEIFDTSDTELRSLNSLEQATHLLVSVPPTVGLGDPVLYHHGNSLRSRLSDGKLQWICYLSSTSVYGDTGGAWVDEDYPANPTSESAKARLAAEEGWLSLGHDLGVSAQVFRLGGIYGPGRSALDTIIKLGSLTEGQRLREAKEYTSRVHVADIYEALKASIETPSSGRIYNIVDDDPAPRAEVFSFARTLIGKRWPEKIELCSSSNNISDANIQKKKATTRGEKRVSNGRLKNELGVKLLHPSYRSGLEQIINFMDYP
ncbi:NAD-dependent epimerase/dehydratase [Macleaya cordata]|uniref:NAD-dependent epimerase/dehydratase n=1 Tax=Macleaya cordata TaxID=56857 RepID=A0A200QE31_MACCD|nr:NAD-dependent epimerase/dehydratase [Macleaya cordata]